MSGRELDELQALLPNCLRQDRLRMEAELARDRGRHSGHGLTQSSVRRLLAHAQRSIEVRHRRHERVPQVSYPRSLPISSRKDDIIAAIRSNQVIVIAGETGSGKTTQIPKMCLEAGLGVEGKIGCTQPRRVAALSISRRIAEELRVNWGQEVGCKIRFTDRSSPLTYIKLMTDGILLAETQGDRDLNEYDAIVIDEAHERSLNIDFLLGHLKLLLARRPDLKLIITSATIDTEAFSKAFGNAPIIEVSGRTYPVEIRYAPHDPDAEESGELTYIDAAVDAVENILLESDRGDVLVFMPSERDIRETQDDLQGRYGDAAEIVPLFGRLSSGEQDRVFAPSTRRKIIVATNIAETSLTIPGVRYVVDTGLARISRYSPRTRTKRLPIEPVSQSSARQRAGRSGRMENGVCIRLYAEEDFAARPKDSQPEIQRANLAEVILKMKAWRLGEIETFPFIDPPQNQAIQSGYQLLQELGALDAERRLTPLGQDLARLPVDPSIGRMILQSVKEGAVEPVLIVAAGLSVQDPRERPMDKQEAANQAHRQFLDGTSDFLTLLNIWKAYDAKFEALRTQNQMRKFCRASFLSYNRMREWVDIHAQLEEAVAALKSARQEAAAGQDAYAAIHRSVLSGLLGHIAQRTDRNLYNASANRQLMLWPGSGLFDRNGRQDTRKPGPGKGSAAAPQSKPRQPAWIVAGEIVETSRLFGRTVAGVDPAWIAELGEPIAKRMHGEPFWDRRSGRVLVRETIRLFGLDVLERTVDYGQVDPSKATEMFVRCALVEDDSDLRHRFVEHNRKLRQRVEVWRTRHRNHRLPNVEDALFNFYFDRLESISSVHDLNSLLRERAKTEPSFLCATEADLTGGQPIAWDDAAFPHEVTVGDQRARLEYAYAPGEAHDGITVRLPAAAARRLDQAMLDWVVPGLRTEQIEHLLKALPKSLRVPLMPIAPKVAELAALLPADAGLDGLRQLVREKYGVAIPADAWRRELLPDHLRPRIAVTGQHEKIVAAGRDLEALKRDIEKHETPLEQQAWARAMQKWERYDLRTWSFGDVPESMHVADIGGAALIAIPGLQVDDGGVHLKLFRKRAEAEAASTDGFTRLVELALHKEFGWVQEDLRSLEKAKELYAAFTTSEELLASAHKHVARHLIRPPDTLLPLCEARFKQTVEHARSGIPGFVPRFIDLVTSLLRLRLEITRHRAFPSPSPAPTPGIIRDLSQLGASPVRPGGKALAFLREELDFLMPPAFLGNTPFERLLHFPRYGKAILTRADRALLNPVKDAERAQQVRPYLEAWRGLSQRKNWSAAARRSLAEFRWLIEEFKVSLFAQELGTSEPVSAKRLDARLAALRTTE
ncbi:MAG: ATP-dependent RNA helicase HrpA [Verrucomicrobiia bacterium]